MTLDQAQYHMTHEQIARELGISTKRVQQLEKKALRKLAGNDGFLRHLLSLTGMPRPTNAFQEAA